MTTNNFELLVDSREPKEMRNAIEKLSVEKGFSIKYLQLVAGDFAFMGTSSGEEISISIERKEATDLFLSIIDGRVKDQSARQSLNFQQIYWIIEGDPFVCNYGTTDFLEYRKKKRQLIGTEVSLTHNKGVNLYFVDDYDGTAYCVYKIIEYALNGKQNIDSISKIMKYSNHNEFSIMTNVIGVLPLANGRTIGFTKAETICTDFGITKFSNILEIDMQKYLTLRSKKLLKRINPECIMAILKLQK